MGPYWIRVSPHPMTGVLEKEENLDMDTHKEECHVTMEAEIGMMHPQIKNAKVFWQLPEARKGTWNSSLRALQKE